MTKIVYRLQSYLSLHTLEGHAASYCNVAAKKFHCSDSLKMHMM